MTGTPILHADLDAFYASVEQRDDRSLAGLPVIVGKGVVLACSYEAKAMGIRTATGVGQALRICPEAKVVAPRMEAYSEASARVYEIFARFSPLVEGLSIDEAFLDVRGLEGISGDPVETAEGLRAAVRKEVGLSISAGLASTKFLAKIASAQAKPDGLLAISPEREREFLAPLPIEAVWGVGRVTSGKLRGIGITTVGELAETDPTMLARVTGRSAAERLVALANNRDPRPVRPRDPRKSFGAQSAFPAGSLDPDEIRATLASLVDRATGRLRDARKLTRTVTVGVRFADMSRATRSRSLESPTDRTDLVLEAARELLDSAGGAELGELTLVGVALGNLETDGAVQMELPLDREPEAADPETPGSLDRALDDLRGRYGTEAVTRASLVERPGTGATPVLPE
ncbi:MAG: DNA polymerase IV [Solirubrobacterales bacterium]